MRLSYNRGYYEHRISLFLRDPSEICKLDQLRAADDAAMRDIRHLESLIIKIQAHRLDLMDRAQYLTTTESTLSVELHRRRTYSGKIEYRLQLIRTYPDRSSNIEQNTVYTGKERQKAIADFKAACKAHPGAPSVLDIQKSAWER